MTRSSPLRRSQMLSSPDRPFRSSFLLDDRNNELNHRDALAAAQIEHDRVREAAIRVYEMHELKEEHDRILAAEKREQERLRVEERIVAEEKKLRELKAKSIPKLPPEPVQPPRRVEEDLPVKTNVSASKTTAPPDTKPPPQTTVKSPPIDTLPRQNGLFSNQNKPAPSNPFATPSQNTNAAQSSPATKPNPFGAPQQMTTTTVTPKPAVQAVPKAQPQPTQPTQDAYSARYLQIHKELKKLRQDLQAQAMVPGSPLKGQMGNYRREIRHSIGQLTSGKGANAQPIAEITKKLREALQGVLPSPAVEVSKFVLEPRQPAEGAPNNEATLPSLFIYFMSIVAKAVINQFINECAANPKAADPIGVFTAHIFSHAEFQWRGKSLIDIVMAKFRVVCPVLFGLRGNDKTDKGMLALGWRKDGPQYITEQSHNDRMSGLGAGFASVSLRDFSKSSKKNPYPPTHYWKALAGIVNSPPNETSNTQYVVLKSMISGHEQRFLNFYGNAGVAALRLAIIEFPKRAPKNASAAASLRALAETLMAEHGLALT